MFKFNNLVQHVDNGSDPKSVQYSQAQLNLYLTYILRDFKPTISKDLLNVYLISNSDNSGLSSLYLGITNEVQLNKMLNIYKDKLINFVHECIIKRIDTIMNTKCGDCIGSLDGQSYRELNKLFNCSPCVSESIFNADDIFYNADVLRMTMFANKLGQYDRTYANFKIEKDYVHVSKDELDKLKKIIFNGAIELQINNGININTEFNSFLSLLFVYASLMNNENSLKYVYDLFVYGNNNAHTGFISKDSNYPFGQNNISLWQYVDLTTALCMFPEQNYALFEPRDKSISDIQAYNLLRLQANNFENDYICEAECY